MVGTHAVETVTSELSDAQLKNVLSKWRLVQEQALLSSVSDDHADALLVTGPAAQAVSQVLSLEVLIEGVPVTAVVDTGAQSTIIARSTLHKVGRHILKNGGKLPTLEKPTVRLYGKDGRKGGRELTITAQLPLSFSVDGKSVHVPVFVQPDSEQPCLLGMNAISSLGMHVLRANGEPILPVSSNEPMVATVNLLRAIIIPSQSGRIVKAHLSGGETSGCDLLFAPNHDQLGPLGVSVQEAVLAKHDGTVLLPMENYQGKTVHLEAGTHLGVAVPIRAESGIGAADHLPPGGSGKPGVATSEVAQVEATEITPERCTHVRAALKLSDTDLPPDEVGMVRGLVCEFADVFALNDSELGCTDLVTHTINTADCAPIRHQPYRTPVVRRQVLSEMIDDMQE